MDYTAEEYAADAADTAEAEKITGKIMVMIVKRTIATP